MKKFRRTKLPKFRPGAENFVRRKILSAEIFCLPKFCPIRYVNLIMMIFSLQTRTNVEQDTPSVKEACVSTLWEVSSAIVQVVSLSEVTDCALVSFL